MDFLNGFISQYPWIGDSLQYLGLLVIVAQAVVVITPTKKDDEWVEKNLASGILKTIVDGIKAFAPIQKKPK